ncbi:MAG: hypothetical protein ACJ73Z_05295 [Rubrobacteraceae bacterium]
MKEAALWISGAAFAFFATAGAFLLLANLGTGPSERNLTPDPPPAESGPALELSLNKNRLASLGALPGQELEVGVRNAGDEDLSHVNLTVEVSSENTALPDALYYRDNVNELPAGSSVPVRFYLDLSQRKSTMGAATSAPAVPESPRKIIEVRATTPEGESAIKTAIVPL